MQILILLTLSLLIIVVFSKAVPFNMDEFIHYHFIMCNFYKWNALNTFRESCSSYDLDVLNTGFILPLRAYHYSGNFPGFYYYPLFLIWKSPLSARFMGVVFLLIQSIILGRLFKIKIYYIFLGLICFFPYFFQHIVDTGPTGFSTVSVILIYALIKKWFETLRLRYPVIVAILVFCGLWTKLSYSWLIPGIVGLFLLELCLQKDILFSKEKFKIFLPQFLFSLSLLIMLVAVMFLSSVPSNPANKPFLDQALASQAYSFFELLKLNWLSLGIIKAFLNPYEATKRIYDISNPVSLTYLYDFLIYLPVPAALVYMWRKAGSVKKELVVPFIFYLLFLITVVMIVRTRASFWMHHAILAFPFLVLSIVSTISLILKIAKENLNVKANLVVKWIIIFVLINSYYFMTFSQQPYWSRGENDPSRIKINTLLNDPMLAKNYFYVIIDWGMYYLQALYGNKEQSVLYMEPLTTIDQINSLKNLSQLYNRKLLFIYNARETSSNIPLIQSNFTVERWNKINGSSVWQVLIEGAG